MSTPVSHTKYSPSKVMMIATCPGYEDREREDEEEDEFSPAAVGSRIHYALEKQDPEPLLSAHESSLYNRANTDLESLLDELCSLWGVERGELNIIREHKFRGITFKGLKEKQSGTADVLIRCGDKSCIADYKMGLLPVTHPKDNSQLMIYGVFEFAENRQCQECYLAVIQPTLSDSLKVARMVRSSKKKHRENHVNFAAKDYRQARDGYKAVISRRNRDWGNPFTYQSSPDVCPYCAKCASCRRVTELAISFSAEVLKEEDLKGTDISNILDAAQNNVLVGKLLSFYKVASEAQNQLKETAKSLNAMGIPVPGWKFGNGGELLTVNKEALTAYLREELTQEELMACTNSVSFKKALVVLLDKMAPEANKKERDAIKQALINDLETSGIVTARKTSVRLLREK